MTLFLLSGMAVMAQEVEKVDASKVKQITFQGDQVTIVYNDGTVSKTADMATITIDFSNITTSIEERMAITEREGLEGKPVYNLKGQLVGRSAARLSKGVYVIDGKKVVIKN
jgi:hypothetical protein